MEDDRTCTCSKFVGFTLGLICNIVLGYFLYYSYESYMVEEVSCVYTMDIFGRCMLILTCYIVAGMCGYVPIPQRCYTRFEPFKVWSIQQWRSHNPEFNWRSLWAKIILAGIGLAALAVFGYVIYDTYVVIAADPTNCRMSMEAIGRIYVVLALCYIAASCGWLPLPKPLRPNYYPYLFHIWKFSEWRALCRCRDSRPDSRTSGDDSDPLVQRIARRTSSSSDSALPGSAHGHRRQRPAYHSVPEGLRYLFDMFSNISDDSRRNSAAPSANPSEASLTTEGSERKESSPSIVTIPESFASSKSSPKQMVVEVDIERSPIRDALGGSAVQIPRLTESSETTEQAGASLGSSLEECPSDTSSVGTVLMQTKNPIDHVSVQVEALEAEKSDAVFTATEKIDNLSIPISQQMQSSQFIATERKDSLFEVVAETPPSTRDSLSTNTSEMEKSTTPTSASYAQRDSAIGTPEQVLLREIEKSTASLSEVVAETPTAIEAPPQDNTVIPDHLPETSESEAAARLSEVAETPTTIEAHPQATPDHLSKTSGSEAGARLSEVAAEVPGQQKTSSTSLPVEIAMESETFDSPIASPDDVSAKVQGGIPERKTSTASSLDSSYESTQGKLVSSGTSTVSERIEEK